MEQQGIEASRIIWSTVVVASWNKSCHVMPCVTPIVYVIVLCPVEGSEGPPQKKAQQELGLSDWELLDNSTYFEVFPSTL